MFVTFGSHRAREKAGRILGKTYQAYYSFSRNLGHGGTWEIPDSEFNKIKDISGVKQLKRTHDLNECWSSGL